jgi:hypothetical protein
MRSLETVPLPKRHLGRIAQAAFGKLEGRAPIAVKVYSMSVLLRVAGFEPDLVPEIRSVIEMQLPLSGPAFQARAKMVLKKLLRP